MPEPSRPRVLDLVLIPAIITLGVTVLRLVGELQGWSPRLFNRAAGGGGALVGISWLPLVFGVYFALRLVDAGERPASAWRALGLAVLGLAIVPAALFTANAMKAPQLGMLVTAAIAFVIGGIVAGRGWPALGRVLFVYALAARVPVAALMLPAIVGKWGTHYDVLPPNFPPMSDVATWALIGLFPQLTICVGFTIIVGAIVGAATAAIARGKGRQTVADAA